MSRLNPLKTPLAAAMLLALAGVAHADDPKYEYKDPSAPPPVDVKKPTVWKANLTLGLTYVHGNAESIGVTGTGLFGVKRYNNEFTLSGGGAYQRSGISAYTPPPGKGGPVTDFATSVENWLVKARYDRYFLERNTVFVSFQSQGDRPAGFIYRLEPQVGYARLFFTSAHQTFRGEIGYDYTFEHRLTQPAPAPQDVQYHSGRLFLYYENKFTTYATFTEGLELLEAFNRLEGFRLNSLTTLSSQIWKNIAIKLNFKIAFNNDPAVRPAATGLPPFDAYPADNTHFDKLDTQLDVVMAVTIL
jgi:putative salt-induced outer membrane protein YdiY